MGHPGPAGVGHPGPAGVGHPGPAGVSQEHAPFSFESILKLCSTVNVITNIYDRLDKMFHLFH